MTSDGYEIHLILASVLKTVGLFAFWALFNALPASNTQTWATLDERFVLHRVACHLCSCDTAWSYSLSCCLCSCQETSNSLLVLAWRWRTLFPPAHVTESFSNGSVLLSSTCFYYGVLHEESPNHRIVEVARTSRSIWSPCSSRDFYSHFPRDTDGFWRSPKRKIPQTLWANCQCFVTIKCCLMFVFGLIFSCPFTGCYRKEFGSFPFAISH